MWEPYQWFLESLHWAEDSSDLKDECGITFCELAVAAHILTDGATSGQQDLCIAIKLMKTAFQKYYKRKFKVNGKQESYNSFFRPAGSINSVRYLGADQMTGVKRRPIFDNEIYSQIQASIWKATQHSRTVPDSHYGEDFYLDKLKMGRWTPDVLLWAQTMCDTNTALRKKPKIAEPPIPVKPKPKPTTPRALVCFYGHLVTSSTTSQGKQIWRRSPTKVWPNVPPGRVLCQKCYQAHSMAAYQGTSQHTFQHLFTVSQLHTNTILHSSPPTPSVPQPPEPGRCTIVTEEDGNYQRTECSICAIDIIEEDVIFNKHLAWYRLGQTCFQHPEHTARPPGE